MNYTGYISMAKTNILCCCHFEFNIAQTSVFLNFLKTVPGENWSLKVLKNQCFINRINSCVENVSQYTLRPQNELHWVDFYGFKTRTSGCCHFKFKITQKLVFFNFLKATSDGNWSLKVDKN